MTKKSMGKPKEKKKTSLQHEQRDTHCTSTAAFSRSIAGEEGAANKVSSLRERWTLAFTAACRKGEGIWSFRYPSVRKPRF
jgi:hypothetical protein